MVRAHGPEPHRGGGLHPGGCPVIVGFMGPVEVGEVVAVGPGSVLLGRDGKLWAEDPAALKFGLYELPDGITFAEWLRRPNHYRVLSAGNTDASLPASAWIDLVNAEDDLLRLWVLGRLASYQGQSKFWVSLRDQVRNWLTEPNRIRWDSPLSKKQWDAAMKVPASQENGRRAIDVVVNGSDLRTLSEAARDPMGAVLAQAMPS